MKDFVLKRVVALLLPFVQVYGLYVVFHGHLSPGGSFAGGIIIGLSLICYIIIFGVDNKNRRILSLIEGFGSYWHGAAALLGIVQGFSILTGKKEPPPEQLGKLFSGGMILLVTIGVSIMVASTMVTLFYSLDKEEN